MILIFLIAISLSMDAFSLSLVYGMNSLSKKEILILSFIVGIYHFFMPIFGMMFGGFIINIFNIGKSFLLFIIFSFIGINMIIEGLKEKKSISKMKISNMLLFGLAVSIDSFSVGINLNTISNSFILCAFIFSLVSFSFTFIGLILGKKAHKLLGRLSTILGGIFLIAIGLFYIIVK